MKREAYAKMMKPQVFTVHGINSSGEWQDRIRAVLEPHFECIPVRYWQYRLLGFVCVVSDPGILLALLAATYIALLVDAPRLTYFFLSFAALAISLGFSGVRRRLTLEHFIKKLDQHRSYLPSHVIAHSFGTYLIGTVLSRFPAKSFERIILTGSVLPISFDWKPVFQRNQVTEVRNEVGRKDYVSFLAFFAYPFAWGLGSAGAIGFRNASHELKGPHEQCEACSNGETAHLHNVILSEFTHSDHFISSDHAEAFWLPFLWGIEPYEFRDFLSICQVAAEFKRESHDHPSLEILEHELGNRPWNFLGRSLTEELRYLLKEQGDEQNVAYALQLIWQSVAKADRERYETEPNENIVLLLKPQTAIHQAARTVRANGSS